MKIDLIILAIVLAAGLLGAFRGAARQVAHWCALAVAYFASRPLARPLAPKAAQLMHVPRVVATLAVTLVLFIVLLVAVRYVLTHLLRSMIRRQGDEERPGVDRTIGFFLGALQAGAIAYLLMSALSFVEEHVSVAGKSLGLSPKDSYAFGLVRRYNLFELTEFAPVRNLVQVVEASRDPARAEKLRTDPAFRALVADPRFKKVQHAPDLQHLFVVGDYGALLRDNGVLELVQDKTTAARLDAAATKAQE